MQMLLMWDGWRKGTATPLLFLNDSLERRLGWQNSWFISSMSVYPLSPFLSMFLLWSSLFLIVSLTTSVTRDDRQNERLNEQLLKPWLFPEDHHALRMRSKIELPAVLSQHTSCPFPLLRCLLSETTFLLSLLIQWPLPIVPWILSVSGTPVKSEQLKLQESHAASRQHKFDDSIPPPPPNHSKLNVTLLISLSSRGNKEIYLVFRAEAEARCWFWDGSALKRVFSSKGWHGGLPKKLERGKLKEAGPNFRTYIKKVIGAYCQCCDLQSHLCLCWASVNGWHLTGRNS